MAIETITSLDLSVIFNPILNFGINCLAILGGFTLLGIIIFLVYSHKNINVFVNQNNKLIDRFPLVSPDFFNKTAKEQNIENNQEIHENNIEIKEINKKFENLEKLVQEVINKCK